ncbi:hypothetical protein GW17_00008836 [Ensete ventricosum]|nr:hypothetical protein GW17_00008836 [Ensete ventricosum]
MAAVQPDCAEARAESMVAMTANATPASNAFWSISLLVAVSRRCLKCRALGGRCGGGGGGDGEWGFVKSVLLYLISEMMVWMGPVLLDSPVKLSGISPIHRPQLPQPSITHQLMQQDTLREWNGMEWDGIRVAHTVALANWRRLDLAGGGHGQGSGLVYGDAERGGAAVEHRAEARRLGLDDAGQLGAARGGGRGGVAGNIAQARREADDDGGAAGLRGSEGREHDGHDGQRQADLEHFLGHLSRLRRSPGMPRKVRRLLLSAG